MGSVGKNAKAARIAAGYSIAELAKAAEVCQMSVRRLEAEDSLLRLDTVFRLCRVLGLTPAAYLLGQTGKGKAHGQRQLPDIGHHAMGARKAKHLSQEQLAERSGVCQVSISYLETGRRGSYTLTALLLAEALGISLDEYLGFL